MDDEQEIRRTLAQYYLSLDSRKFEETAALFTEDAVNNKVTGRAAILQSFKSGTLAKKPELQRKHVSPNVVIDVQGDQAWVTSDLLIFDQLGDQPLVVSFGETHDQLVRQKGKWRFASRQVKMHS